jgi:hypothetical protein
LTALLLPILQPSLIPAATASAVNQIRDLGQPDLHSSLGIPERESVLFVVEVRECHSGSDFGSTENAAYIHVITLKRMEDRRMQTAKDAMGYMSSTSTRVLPGRKLRKRKV